MPENKLTASQIVKEQRNISKYAGLLFARIVLLICMFFILVPLRPTSFYIFAFLAIYPWAMSNFFFNTKKAAATRLTFCARKYFYTPARLDAEKNTGVGAILFLAAWQINLTMKPPAIQILQLAPGFLLLLYLICRIFATAVIRHRIHRYYATLEILDSALLPPDDGSL